METHYEFDRVVFASRLKESRLAMQMTQTDAARLVGMTYGSYSRYEHAYNTPTLETATKFAVLFNVSLDYLAGLTDDPTTIL